MGRDKATLEYEGTMLGRRALDALREAGAHHIALVGARDEHADIDAVRVADREPGAGPLGGVVAALTWAPVFPVVTLPCDLPAVSARDVRALFDALDPAVDAVIAEVDGRSTHLVAAWNESALAGLVAAERSGVRSMAQAIESLVVATHVGGPRLRDADTPDDLEPSRYRVPMGTVPHLDIDQLATLHRDGGAILDVRQADEYDEAHVPGAVLVPLNELTERVDEVPTGDPLAVICKSGARSLRACEFLMAQGFEVANVSGGTMAWIEQGHAVATGMERG